MASEEGNAAAEAMRARANAAVKEPDVKEVAELVSLLASPSPASSETDAVLVEWLPRAVEAVLKRPSGEPEAVEAVVVAAIDVALGRLEGGEDSLPLARALDAALTETHKYYREYGPRSPPASEDGAAGAAGDVPENPAEDTDETREWRAGLALADWVDVYSAGAWRIAQVEKADGDRFEVCFEGKSFLPGAWVDRSSPRLAPLHSRSRDSIEPWRLALDVGAAVDALDPYGYWYTALVRKVEGERLTVSYDGWPARYNETVVRTSERLAPIRSRARGGKGSGGVRDPPAPRTFDDSEDPDGAGAVFRSPVWGTYAYVRVADHFLGPARGLERVAARAARGGLPVRQLRLLVEAAARPHSVLARPLALRAVPELRRAVFGAVLGLDDALLRGLSKENLAGLVRAVGQLARRVEGAGDAQRASDLFGLESAMLRLRCNVVERRINGMAHIADYVSKVRVSSSYSPTALDRLAMAEWIEENGVLDRSLGQGAHPELMKRSGDILRFLGLEKRIGREHMDLVWTGVERAARRKDDATAAVLLKVLEDVVWHLEEEHVVYLFDLMGRVPVPDFNAATLDLVKELSRLAYRAGPQVVERAAALLWRLMADEARAEDAVADAARDRLQDVLGEYSGRDHRLPYARKCLENVRQHRSVPQSLAILHRVLLSFPTAPNSSDRDSRWTVIMNLDAEEPVLGALFDDLAHFKGAAAEAAAAAGLAAPANSLAFGASRVPYLEQLRSRMTFLRFVLANSGLELAAEHTDALWTLLHDRAATPEEAEGFFVWLASGIELEGRQCRQVLTSAEVAAHLFADRMTCAGTDYAGMGLARYECVERFFVLLNADATALRLTGPAPASVAMSYLSPAAQAENDVVPGAFVDAAEGAEGGGGGGREARPSYEFEVTDFGALRGFDAVWAAALEAADEAVKGRAIAFLNQLHENLAPALAGRVGEVRGDYIAKCMRGFGEHVDGRDHTRIHRCLELLNHLLDASERRGGVGKLRSHGAQVRGRARAVVVQNNVAQSKRPKRSEIRVRDNDTLLELRAECSAAVGVAADSLRIFYNGKDLDMDAQGGRLVHDTMKLDPITVMVSRRAASSSHDGHHSSLPVMLNSQGYMLPALSAALGEVYSRFARPDGTMTKKDMATYILACNAPAPSANDERMSVIFTDHGDDEGDKLTLEGFRSFYMEACRSRPAAVWSDLQTHGYDENFRRRHDAGDGDGAGGEGADGAGAGEEEDGGDGEASDADRVLPRYLLSSNEEYFDLLFRALALEQGVASRIWLLLQRLPTNPAMRERLASLDQVHSPEPEWNALLDSRSPYRLLYALQIAESLADVHADDEAASAEAGGAEAGAEAGDAAAAADDEAPAATGAAAATKATERLEWQRKFLLSGGFRHLYGILVSHRDLGLEHEGDADGGGALEAWKGCLALLLKMMGTFILSALAVSRPMARTIRRVRCDSVEVRDAINGAGEAEEDDAGGSVGEGDASDDDDDDDDDDEARPAFVALVRQMSTGFADQLLGYIDFPQLQQALLELMHLAAASGERSQSATDARVVEYATGLWVAVVLYQPDELLPAVYDEFGGDAGSARLFALLHCRLSPAIRKEFANGVYQICTHCRPAGTEPPRAFFTRLLTAGVPTSEAGADTECAENFWLLCRLVRDGGALDAAAVRMLLVRVVMLLRSHRSTESRDSARADRVLVGTLQLAAALLRRQPGAAGVGMARFVFDSLLFGGPGGQPKCHSRDSRAAALRLLTTLARDPACHAAVLELVARQQSGASRLTGFDYSVEKHMRSPCGYVGLRNMGATCYMNSLLQQFYMIPQFRYAVLMADTEPDEDRRESLLYQLQQLFSFLTLSDKQAYDTEPFCHAYKDERGQPINVRVQQDAQEFFNVLADRLENRLKGTPQATLLKDLFGGRTANQIICHGGCETVREREEDYYTVSLEVKNVAGLEDSLQRYVEGEVLSDFNCDACGRRVDITKRACLSELPHTLIFHLKRFELNFETFEHEKVNTRFAFPLRTNLEPFTKEGLVRRDAERRMKEWQEAAAAAAAASGAAGGEEAAAGGQEAPAGAGEDAATAAAPEVGPDAVPEDESKTADDGPPVVPERFSVRPAEYYDYQLVGILIHTGTAQAGHYYSFVKDRSPGAAAGGRWNEFNDNYVRPFDVSQIEEKAFGGEHTVTESSYWGTSTYSRQSEQITNAYMLVYERVDPGVLQRMEAAADGAAPAAAASEGGEDAASPPSGTSSPVSIERIKALVERSEEEGRRPRSRADSLAALDRALSSLDVRSVLPGRVLGTIEADNAQFARDRQIFSADFFAFFSDLAGIARSPPVLSLPPAGEEKEGDPNTDDDGSNPGLRLVQVGTRFALDTLARAAENDSFPALVGHLCTVLRANLPACRWLLLDAARQGRAATLVDLLLVCRDGTVRKGVAQLYEEAAAALAPHEGAAEAVDAFLDTLFGVVLPEAPKNWVRFGELFSLMHGLASRGPALRHGMVERRAVELLGNIYLGEQSPNRDAAPFKVPVMGSRMGMQPNFATLLDTLSLLVRSCATDAPPEAGRPPTQELGEPLPARAEDRALVLCQALYTVSLHGGNNPDAVGQIVAHWAFESERQTDDAFEVLLGGLQAASHDSARPYFVVLGHLLGVEDSLQQRRFAAVLAEGRGVVDVLLGCRRNYGKFVYASIKLLLEILDRNRAFAAYMMEHRQRWVWMDGWLKVYISQSQYGKPPTLKRQESREQTFSKYQQHVESLGGTLDLEAGAEAETEAGAASAAGEGEGAGYTALRPTNLASPGGYSSGAERMCDDSDSDGPPAARPGHKRSRSHDNDGADLRNVVLDGLYGPASYVGGGALVPAGPVVDNGVPAGSRGSGGGAAAATSEPWRCLRCTFDNVGSASACDACEAARPA